MLGITVWRCTGGQLKSTTTHKTVFNRVLVTESDIMMTLISYHDNITPFMSRQCYSFYVTTMLLLLRHNSITPRWAVSSFLVRQLVILFLKSWLQIILLPWFFSKCHRQITPLECRILPSEAKPKFLMGAVSCATIPSVSHSCV